MKSQKVKCVVVNPHITEKTLIKNGFRIEDGIYTKHIDLINTGDIEMLIRIWVAEFINDKVSEEPCSNIMIMDKRNNCTYPFFYDDITNSNNMLLRAIKENINNHCADFVSKGIFRYKELIEDRIHGGEFSLNF